MHSSIFDDQPAPDMYSKKGQHEVYEKMKGSLRANNCGAPEISLPRPADMRCTQNADHGAVIPGSQGPREPMQMEMCDGEMRTPRMPRCTGQEVLVHAGEAKPVIHAGHRDTEAIPKEFWATSANLQWHDLRNEQCRNRVSDRRGLTAEQTKRQELSSEVFGKPRITDASSNKLAARQDLLPESADHLKTDSTLHKNQGLIPSDSAHQGGANDRLYSNLADSGRNPLNTGSPIKGQQPMPEEDPANMNRRRGEKNFSDLFGAEMGDRKEVRGNREEVLGTGTCSFLDARGEIAARNKEHWRTDTENASGRKHQETSSRLFNYTRPERPVTRPDEDRLMRDEGACWEAPGAMLTTSEIARRRRNKDFNGDFEDKDGATHLSRKQDDLASGQMRRNMGQAPPHEQQSRSGCPSGPNRANPPHRVTAPWATDPAAASAQDRKLASLQSSIFS